MKDGAAASSPSARRIYRMATLRTPSLTWVFAHPARSSSSLKTTCPRSSTSRRRTANALGVSGATSSRYQSLWLVRSREKSPNVRRRPASIVAPSETRFLSAFYLRAASSRARNGTASCDHRWRNGPMKEEPVGRRDVRSLRREARVHDGGDLHADRRVLGTSPRRHAS